MQRSAILALAAITLSAAAGWAWSALDRSPGEVLRHVDRRLQGHPAAQALLSEPFRWMRQAIDPALPHPPSPLSLRGALAAGMPTQTYDANGLPEEVHAGEPASPAARRRVSSTAELVAALEGAQPGDIVEILPGRYGIQRTIRLTQAGTAQAPILLRAASLGTVRIELQTDEGFVVAAPYWIFENLHLVGNCAPAAACEHAFHVVGQARATVLRNNVLQDFNNALKVNGLGGNFPDHGLVQHNHVFNTRIRETDSPVVGIDVVGASGWRIVDNLVADIAKGSQGSPSYAAFMKGGGSDGHFERNLVVCRLQLQGDRDIRVGLSLGGGGTGSAYARQGEGGAEFVRGTVANNFISFCNDSGIDLNRSADAYVAFNTLIATAGIDLRNPPSNASLYGNLLDGRIRSRSGSAVTGEYNVSASSRANLMGQPDEEWAPTQRIPVLAPVAADFCGRPRGGGTTRPGAFASSIPCPLLQSTPLRLLDGGAAPNS